MGTEEPITLQRLLARRLRELRIAHNARQEDMADGALMVGLDWTRSTVAAIEAGRRALSIEEFILLPVIVAIGYGAACRLDELLGVTPQGFQDWRDEPIALTRFLTVSLSDVWPVIVSDAGRTNLVNRAPMHEAHMELGTAAAGVGRLTWRANRVRRSAFGLAEQHAAERLETSPLAVSVAAHRLWKRSFSEERDRRLAEKGEASPRTLQARRGHITRAMLAEIRHAFPDLKELERRGAEAEELEREDARQRVERQNAEMERRIRELEERVAQYPSTPPRRRPRREPG